MLQRPRGLSQCNPEASQWTELRLEQIISCPLEMTLNNRPGPTLAKMCATGVHTPNILLSRTALGNVFSFNVLIAIVNDFNGIGLLR